MEIAALNGHVDLAKYLLSEKIPVGLFDGWSPLHAAAVYSYPECLEVVKLLVQAGADVNAKTAKAKNGYAAGLTPYGVASLQKYKGSFGTDGYSAMSAYLKSKGGK